MSEIGTDLLFKTQTLTRVVNDLRIPEHGLLKNIATSTIQFEEEEILFDEGRPTQFLAPWVLPTVQGKIIEERSFQTSGLKPAYIKMKTPCDIHRAFRRSAGEQVGGTMSPRARAMMAVNENLAQHKDIWMNRLEWMLANMLVHGGYAVYGEDYPLRVLDFGRPANNTIRLTGNEQWISDHADSNVSDFLQDWASLFAKNGGGRLATLIMGVGAWKAFRNHRDVTEKFDWASNPKNMTQIETGSVMGRGLEYKGSFDNFAIWVYQDWYISDGTEYRRDFDTGNLVKDDTVNEGDLRPFIPVNGVIGVDPAALLATRAFGAIKDEHFLNGMTARPMATRSWVEDDPGQRMLLTQSAPLIFPYRAMASAYCEVYQIAGG